MANNTTRVASGSSTELDGPECLLRHANEVRRHANLDTLDAYLSQSGYSWIDMMISHAKDSFEGYQQQYKQISSNSTNGRQAFEHQMAAELLKTPSPKKKRAAALRHKLPSARPKMHTIQSNDPFSDDTNKENQTTLPSSSVKDMKEKIIKDGNDPNDGFKEVQRNTRSKGDKSQLVQIPNPFLSRTANTTNTEQSNKVSEEESVPNKAKESKKQAIKAKTKAKAKIVPEQAADVNQKEVSQNTKSKKTISTEDKAMPPPKAPVVQKVSEANEFEDDSREVEYSLQVAPHEDLAASRIGNHSQRTQPSQPIQKQVEMPKAIGEKEIPASIEDEEKSDEEYEIKRTTQRKSESPSPRESTPPPLSPTKAQRAAHTMKARERLEESLLKLASDAEDSEDDERGEVSMSEVVMKGISSAPKAAKAISSQATQKVSQHQTKAKATAAAEEEDDDNDNGAGDESTVEEEAIIEQQKVQTAAAPKRTLSSITHAKKSMVGSSSGIRQHGRNSSMAPSATTGGAKTSFLSKSIMRVEQDQKSLDDSLELIAPSTSSLSSSAEEKKADGKKRKSNEAELEVAEDAPAIKMAKKDVEEDDLESNSANKLEQNGSKHTQDEKQKSSTGGQAQSFRQKIESFNSNKTSHPTTNASSAQTKSSRNFSSMSTHSVGIGATKISSPIFSRSNSQNTLAPEPQSPSHDIGKIKESVQQSPKATRSDAKKDQFVLEKIKEPVSTTPLNSPGPSALSLYPKLSELQKKQRQAAKSTSPIKADKRDAAKESQVDDDLSDSDLGAYDTSTDGDLSLVDLVDTNATMKASATAPRPPGTSLRPISVLPKTTGTTPASTQKNSAFMPSGTVNAKTSRPVSRLGKPMEDQSISSAVSTASSNTATSTATSSSLNNSVHATWGGSISSKLKGILGFSSTSPGKNSTATAHMSASTSTKPSSINSKHGSVPINIPTRKESFISSNQGNPGSRIGTTTQSTTSTEKKPVNVIRSDLVKKKEAEQAEKRAKEKEKLVKTGAVESATKRARDEQSAQQATKSKPANVGPAAGKAISSQHGQGSVQRPVNVTNQPDAKKRKSNDGIALSTNTKTITKQASSQALKIKAATTSINPGTSSQINKAASIKPSQTNPTANVFSNHNPFQSAQSSQQQQALAAVSQQMQIHKAKNVAQSNQNVQMLSPNSKMKIAATGHIELEEPDSAYSDSEDEETIRKRLQHKPWETREGLAIALEAQAEIDADLIFGIPQGAVPLDDILPAQSEHARVRRMRPRSSSATWSRDGLKQFEIDRYNERMGIKGPGASLTVGSGISRDDGSGTPNKVGRMSALAQSAIAQGQMSSKKQR